MSSDDNRYQLQTKIAAAASAVVIFLVLGSVVFHQLEDWTWIQSFYFSVVTLTTVGYGDLVPTSDATRLFTAFFILLGVTVVVSAIGFIGNAYIQYRALKKSGSNGKKD